MACPFVFLCSSPTDTQPFTCFVFFLLLFLLFIVSFFLITWSFIFFCFTLLFLALPPSCTFNIFITSWLQLLLPLSVSICVCVLLLTELLVCCLCLHASNPLLVVYVEEKEAVKTEKSNCLLAFNSPRHPLQSGCLYPRPGGRRGLGRGDGGGCTERLCR